FWSANLNLFRDLLQGIAWYRALEKKGVQENWTIFKYHFLQAQDQCIPMSKKSGKRGRRPAWMSRELLANLKWKKELYGMWKKGRATWKDYRNIIRVCRDAVRKAKAHLELSLVRDIKDNKKGFYKKISSKRKIRKNVGLLLNYRCPGNGRHREGRITECLFASVFTAEDGPQKSHTLGVKRRPEKGRLVRDWLNRLNSHKSMGPDSVNRQLLRELADVALPLSIIFEKSWRMEEVPDDWRKANVTPIFKRGKKEDLGNYWPVSLTSIPGKVIEQIILEVISKHVEEKKTIRSSQHGFTKGKSCLTNLTALYDDMAEWVDEGRAVDVVYLDFSKAFDTPITSL
ncbi:RTBS polymerase, partial [Mohoua ochrocephala]|nr:RTBS polymerase [Mohoua ochrocephala]